MHCALCLLGLVLLDKARKFFERSLSAVVNDLVLLRDELQSGVATSLEGRNRNVVGSGINLCNHHIVILCELLAQLLIGRSELLAVSTPRGIHLNQNILFFIHDDVIEGLAGDDLDRAIVVSGLLFALQESLDITLDYGISELPDSCSLVDLLLSVGVDVLDVVLGVQSYQVRKFADLSGQAEDIRANVSSSSHTVSNDEDGLSFVALCHSAGALSVHVGSVSVSTVDEENHLDFFAGHGTIDVALVHGIFVCSDSPRSTCLNSEGTECIRGDHLSLKYDLFLVEFLEQDHSGYLRSVLLSDGIVGDRHKLKVITKGVSSGGEVLISLGGSEGSAEETNHNYTIGLDGAGKHLLVRAQILHGRAGTLLQVIYNTSGISGALIGLRVCCVAAEDLQRRVAPDFVLGGDCTVVIFSGIYLCEDNINALSSEGGCSLLVFGSKLLAVSTPGGVKLNYHELRLRYLRLEVISIEDEDTIFLLHCSRERQSGEEQGSDVSEAHSGNQSSPTDILKLCTSYIFISTERRSVEASKWSCSTCSTTCRNTDFHRPAMPPASSPQTIKFENENTRDREKGMIEEKWRARTLGEKKVQGTRNETRRQLVVESCTHKRGRGQ
mmetsp:Transcript_28497/g.72627  ORF Transcript_28497/g.72627 Transcript_28497/m.72627 type:complete len:611 (-) Transcript_28497:1766-3598(-)